MQKHTPISPKNNPVGQNYENSAKENQGIQNKHISTTKNATFSNQDDYILQGSFCFGNNYFIQSQKIVQQVDEQTDLDLSFCQKIKFQHEEVLLSSFDKYINQSQFRNFTEGIHQFSKFDLREQTQEFEEECLEKVQKNLKSQDFEKINSMIKTIHHKSEYLKFKLFNSILKFMPQSLANSLFTLVRQLFIFSEKCTIQLKSKPYKDQKQQIQSYVSQNQQKLLFKISNNIQLEELFPLCLREVLKSQFQQFIQVWSYTFCMCLQGYYKNKYLGQIQQQEVGQLFHFSDENFWGQEKGRKPSKKVKRSNDQ